MSSLQNEEKVADVENAGIFIGSDHGMDHGNELVLIRIGDGHGIIQAFRRERVKNVEKIFVSHRADKCVSFL